MTKPPKSATKKAAPKKAGTSKAGGGKRVAPAKAKPAARKAVKSVTKAAVRQSRGAARTVTLDGATAEVLNRLFEVITSRRDADPNISHSARLLSRGTAKVAQKFGEEAVECLIEAVSGNSAALIGESADVLYHLIVLWVDAGLRPADVWSELARREGTSGIAEKASRTTPPGE